jgi:endonuclease/exonuclease/phosphatase (EEP) superfamily protein YafD
VGRRPSPSAALVLVLARLLALALAALLVVRGLGLERGTLLALLLGALPLTLLPSYAVVAAAAVLRRRRLALLGCGLVVGHLLVLSPALGAAELPDGAEAAPRLRVVTANLYVLNPDPAAAGRALRELRPDVLVVPELSPDGMAGLRASGLLDDLPHSVVELGTRDETVGLFSRRPLADVSTHPVGGRQLPRATVSVGGVDVRLLAAHPLPPLSVLEPIWRASLADLAQEADDEELPVVVAGDLNSDRDHAAFRGLLDAGLRDAHDAVGRGLARTFPAGLPLLQLDHVLVRDGEGGRITPLDVREVRVPGSDHLGVLADLAVQPGS